VNILGPSSVSVEAAQAWARSKGAHERAVNVAPLYWSTCPRYGIPPEIAFVQAMHETAFGKFNGVVPSTYRNWAGIKTKQGGSNTSASAHQVFPSDEVGVLAHVQHLARYAGAETVHPDDFLVDPRWDVVTKFTDTVEGLGGAWAPSPIYGTRLVTLVEDLRSFANDGSWNVPATGAQLIPGVRFIPADSRHYTKGRTVAWPDLWIFHHSNGWDSLAWLTTSPNSNVSSTLLLWHDGTIRAQLVRLGDTPHTTGVYNARSLSSEWERKWPEQRDISDTQYANIADSVTKALLAERARGNPHWQGIPPRSQFGDHNDYYDTACPGNLNVDRLYELIVTRLAAATPTKPDDGNPWYLHLGDGVLAQYAYRRGFRGVVEGLAQSRFPSDPNSAALAMFGPPDEEEWRGVDGRVYQRARKMTLVYTPDNAVPWDVAALDKDAVLPERAT
jgi:hypothetical protein